MTNKEGDYIFFVESTGAIAPLDIFRKATEILKNKAKEFENAYKDALEVFQKKK
jgi:DNA-directed RNA polymerase alpha subunit